MPSSRTKTVINEIKMLLNNNPRYTLLEYFMPPTDEEPDMGDAYSDEPLPTQSGDYIPMDDDMPPMDGGGCGDVSAELAQIRQIAIQTLAKLAECPQSEGYITMKKIWSMCDKASEPKQSTPVE